MNNKVLVIGSANIDFVLNTPVVPNAGETLLSNANYTFVPGGKGANAAVAASRLGGDVAFCARVGDDAYGDRLSRIYMENNIDRRFVAVDALKQTGLAVVMVERDGTNRIIVYPGANSNIAERDIEASLAIDPAIVLTNLEIPTISVQYTGRLCQSKNIPLVLDCGGVSSDFKLEKIPEIEILSPNETETAILTGIRPNTLDDCLKACIKLHNITSIKYTVLKLGARGSYIYDGKYCDICGPYEVNAVDTTAAGDAFTAAMTLEYIRNGGDVYSACRFGNAVGALTVTKTGALTSLPTSDEVEVFMATHSQI